MKNFLSFLTLLFCSLYGVGQNYTDTLDVKLKTFHEAEALPGFACVIVNMDSVLYRKSLGYSDLKTQTLYTSKTVQCIASTSKTVIAYAVMKLQEAGKLSLESPINQFLPFKVVHPHFPDSVLRIKHLVTHTSGIGDTENNYDLRRLYFTNKTDLQNSQLEKEDLDWFALSKKNKKLPLKTYCKNVFSSTGKWHSEDTFHDHPFGSHYQYTNLGAVLMAYIVERVSEKRYKKYIQKNLFKVLKMEKTAFDEKKVPPTLLAKSYVTEDLVETPAFGDNTYPDGGIYTNIEELSAYLIEMIKGYNGKSKLLSQSSFQQMMSPLLPQEIADTHDEGKKFANIGVLWQFNTEGGIMHNGGNPLGGTVYMSFDPKTNIGRILMTNCDVRVSKVTIIEFISIWRTLGKYADKVQTENE